MAASDQRSARRTSRLNRLLVSTIMASSLFHVAVAEDVRVGPHNWQANFFPTPKRTPAPEKGPPHGDWNGSIPLLVTNKCDTTIWPGVITQSGTGPGIGGFQLDAGDSRQLWVAPNWQGRVWGRTNCTVNGDSASCKTGDCFGKMDCQFSVRCPSAEELS